MPHIKLPQGVPGIVSLFQYRPEAARPLKELTEFLLCGENSLTRGERELIASYVSSLNHCEFCTNIHGAAAGVQLDGGRDLVAAVRADYRSADISPKIKALLAIAALVQEGGMSVTSEAVAAARDDGATDVEIHDTVLIAAAFCMYNRYVDGLATWAPKQAEAYVPMARKLAENGYLAGLGRSAKP